MNSPLLLSLALGCGWIFSSESLMIAGNSAGTLGWLVIPLLLGTVLLLICNSAITHNVARSNNLHSEIALLKTVLGTLPTVSVALASCFPLLIFATTGLLVTAGYTFNEVFLYWFPNFGFAFLLLFCLTICQLLPTRYLIGIQLLLITLAALGLLILGLYGIFSLEQPVTAMLTSPRVSSSTLLSTSLLLLLFVGPTLTQGTAKEYVKRSIFVLAILLPWLLASISHVPAERLAHSTIPFMTAARKIMGEPGRQLMGVVVIAGSSAAVTALFLLCRQKLKELAYEAILPSFFATAGERWVFAPIAAIIIATCMATGLAGDEILEILLRSALLLWLFSHCLVSIAAWSGYTAKSVQPMAARFPAILLTIGCGAAVYSSPHPLQLLGYSFLFLIACGGLALPLVIIHHRQKETS